MELKLEQIEYQQQAVKYCEALGIEAKIHYYAPVKEYSFFTNKAEELANV